MFTGYIELKNRDDLSNLSKYSTLKHFYGVKIDSNMLNIIKITDDYIVKSNEKVYILDTSASAYMIPIDRYNKNYDLFCIGNFGKGNEEQIIENIIQQNDSKFLILNSNCDMNWQMPMKVINYVKENFSKSGQIGIFDIYEKK